MPSCLPLNNKPTIQYDSATLRKIGNASHHDKYYEILPFGCIQVIRNLDLTLSQHLDAIKENLGNWGRME